MNEDNNAKAGPESARDAAIDWLMRQNDGPLSRAEKAAFTAWLASDEANRAAFDDISEMYGHLGTMEFGAAPVQKAKRSWRGVALSTLAATSVALFVFFDDLSLYLRSDHYAAAGETKLVTLDDGSHVELDAKSAMTVRYSAGERRLTLLEGEAWFEVAPDPARPFVVEALGGTVTALGTAFDVALEKARAQVTVTQHRVSVASGGRNVVVEEGQQSAYSKSAASQAPRPVDVERATAWRRGMLIFENKPLGEVVEALGRYHRGHVYFVDSALRARRVTGVFGADDPLLALEEIETALGLHAVNVSKYLIFLYE